MTFPILDIEKSSVEKYLSNMVQDSNHRFKSWEYCYTAFGNLDSVDYLSLHLAFYLASWGMYRGSCGILWKDYTKRSIVTQVLHVFQLVTSMICFLGKRIWKTAGPNATHMPIGLESI